MQSIYNLLRYETPKYMITFVIVNPTAADQNQDSLIQSALPTHPSDIYPATIAQPLSPSCNTTSGTYTLRQLHYPLKLRYPQQYSKFVIPEEIYPSSGS